MQPLLFYASEYESLENILADRLDNQFTIGISHSRFDQSLDILNYADKLESSIPKEALINSYYLGYQFDQWIVWRGSPFHAPMPEWSSTADYSIGDRVYFKPSTSSISTIYVSLQDALISGGGTPQQPDVTPNYWQAAGALDNADSLTDAKFTVNGSDAEIRATFTAVAQPVSPPASTSTYTINVGGSLSSGYVIAGVDANGNLNGSRSNTPINNNVADTIIPVS